MLEDDKGGDKMRGLFIISILVLFLISACEQKAEYINKNTDYLTIHEIKYTDVENGDGYKVKPKKAVEIYVEDKVIDELKRNGRATVVIELNDENLGDKGGEELRRMIQDNQRRLMEVLSEDEFKLLTRFDKVNAITAEITMKGFQKLKSMPHLVEGIKSIRIIMPNAATAET